MSLRDAGYLFLGTSESVGNLSDGFDTIDSKAKIYRQLKGYTPPYLDSFGTPRLRKNKADLHSIKSFLKPQRTRLLMSDGVFESVIASVLPPSVIIDENYDILHTVNQVNRYISLPVGQVSLNLLKMLPKQLGVLVSSLLRRLEKSDGPIEIPDIDLPAAKGRYITISGNRFMESKSGEIFYLISFVETEKRAKTRKSRKEESADSTNHYLERIEELEKEVQFKGESLQATVEELETSNEELQSSNEELIASNEELQSTNEELQSVNEELYTVNSEYVKKID
jgi:two-component system CheB/CheR fusion protein